MEQLLSDDGWTLWRVSGGNEEAICVVDFARFGDVTTLAERIGAEHTDHPVYRTDPVADLTGRDAPVTLTQLGLRYSRLLRWAGVRPVLVASYCSTALLALTLAAQLEVPAGVTVLVEPTWPDRDLVHCEASDIASKVTGQPHPIRSTTLADMLAEIRVLLRRSLTDDEPGDDQALIEEMLFSRYQAWLTFLDMSTQGRIPGPPPGLHMLLSPDGGYGPPAGWPSGCPITTVDLPHDQLLEYPAVGRLIHTFAEAARTSTHDTS